MPLERILLVDDEPNVLDGYKRGLRGRYEIRTALSGIEAVEILQKEDPFAVIVSDMRMPGMNGVEFLNQAKSVCPDSVRIMLTGNADQETAIMAVNQGHIFRFLNKPCSIVDFSTALEAATKQYHIVIAEKEVLEKTLMGSIEMLTQILSFADPQLFALVGKVKKRFSQIAKDLEIENPWTMEVAIMLSPLGLLTLPLELKKKIDEGAVLSKEEEAAAAEVPEISSRLLGHIPRLEETAELIRCGVAVENKSHSGSRLSESARTALFATRVLFDLVNLEKNGMPLSGTFDALKKTGKYNTGLLERISKALQKNNINLFLDRYEDLSLSFLELLPEDELIGDVITHNNRLLLVSGVRITSPILERLANYKKLLGIMEPIKVRRLVSKNRD